LSNLTKAIPQIHFPTYFSTFNIRTFPESVIVTYLDYPPALSQILRETSSEVVEGYLVTRAALSLSPYLGMNTPAWQAQRALVETLTGIKKGAVGDRAEYCIGKTEEVLGFAAGRYFVNVTFGGDSKEKGTKVISGASLTPWPKSDSLPFNQTSSRRSKNHLGILIGWMKSLRQPQPRR